MSDLREKVAAKLAETIYDWENTHRTTTRAMTDDEFIQYSSEVLADAAISICMEEAAKVADKRADMAGTVSEEAARALLVCLPDAIRSLKGGDGEPR